MFSYNDIYLAVRWLSAGQALKRLFELREPVTQIIEERANARIKRAMKLVEIVRDDGFWITIGFLSDTLAVLNKTNKQLQGANKNYFEVSIVVVSGFL